MLLLLLGLFSCLEKPNNALDVDDDRDGFSEFDGDCDDTNPNAFPGAAELDSTDLCMVDNDGDGYGDDSVENFSGAEGHRGSDCDDSDPSTVNDMDCDGVLTTDDCDDADPSTVNDMDCDGVLPSDDCDDNDASTINDMDCDGVLTADDCDDNDSSSTIVSED